MTSPVVIAGAGPTGIACAVELSRRGVAAVCFDRRYLLATIDEFPEQMRWFSTRDLLDIAGIPFPSVEAHPTRLESLAYYRSVAERFSVAVRAGAEVLAVRPAEGGAVRVRFADRLGESECAAPAAILANGFFHNPRRLGVPGEEMPHVHARYRAGWPFHGRRVVVVGGKNSASEAALDLYRHGAKVTLVVRGPALSERVKYWIKPDLENRIKEGAVRGLFSTRVCEITPDGMVVEGPEGRQILAAEAIFPLVGYEPDYPLFARCGIALEGEMGIPSHDPDTLESNVPGLYLAGALLGGRELGRIFIENTRHHAGRIADAIARRLPGAPAPAEASTAGPAEP
jgi:thioredoxin reductase (NADPH)